MINDILDISRIESGMVEIDTSKFELCNSIKELVSMIKPQADEKNITLEFDLGNCEIEIITDNSKFSHILQNLVGNAIKFTEKGGINISVKKTGEQVAISVADSGIGISEDNLLHIFNEFRQADSGISRRFGGSGIGLSISKKYANLLGGTLTVESVPEKGSVFTLTLPLVYNKEKHIPEDISDNVSLNQSINKPELQTHSDGTKTVMLVEDSEPAVVQIRDFLEEYGYNVVVAKNGTLALEMFNQLIPDAIILDLMMPGIDGLQVLQSIRNAEITSHIPVLILTAKYVTKEDLKLLRKNRIYQLLQKGDVKRSELVKLVGEMIGGKKAEKEMPVIKQQTKEGKPIILVVEDNPDNMITVKALLEESYTVIEAVNGMEGIAKAKKHLPDLILMDISLPEKDGIQSFKAIRSEMQTQHIPVIALTASALKEDRELVLAYGFNAFIAKPIDETIFYNTIKKTLYG